VPHLGKPINDYEDTVITRLALTEAGYEVHYYLFPGIARDLERV
jgi:hypothetical protein